MGNRAVIVSHDTTLENKCNKVGIYVHWCGSERSVKAWLAKAKETHIRDVDYDPQYFWARFCQIICNDFSADGGEESNILSVGIGPVSQLDVKNYDNGVYYIDKDFDIVAHTTGEELLGDYEGARNIFNCYLSNSAGSFHTKLLDAWDKADSLNRKRLEIAFPELARAIKEHTDSLK